MLCWLFFGTKVQGLTQKAPAGSASSEHAATRYVLSPQEEPQQQRAGGGRGGEDEDVECVEEECLEAVREEAANPKKRRRKSGVREEERRNAGGGSGGAGGKAKGKEKARGKSEGVPRSIDLTDREKKLGGGGEREEREQREQRKRKEKAEREDKRIAAFESAHEQRIWQMRNDFESRLQTLESKIRPTASALDVKAGLSRSRCILPAIPTTPPLNGNNNLNRGTSNLR